MDRPQYVNWIVREDGVVFEDQQPLNCYRLSYVRDDAILDDWALHIRKQYVPDGELEQVDGRGILAPIYYPAKRRTIWTDGTVK